MIRALDASDLDWRRAPIPRCPHIWPGRAYVSFDAYIDALVARSVRYQEEEDAKEDYVFERSLSENPRYVRSGAARY